jgi:hypothetical protein
MIYGSSCIAASARDRRSTNSSVTGSCLAQEDLLGAGRNDIRVEMTAQQRVQLSILNQYAGGREVCHYCEQEKRAHTRERDYENLAQKTGATTEYPDVSLRNCIKMVFSFFFACLKPFQHHPRGS